MFVQGASVYEYQSGRKMPGAPDYKRKDTVDFKVNRLNLYFKILRILFRA